jgi:hypothetical protein
MSSCCLRRTKEMQDKTGQPLIPLPPVVINVVRVQLDEKSREIYDAVESESRELVHNFYANGGHRDDVRLLHVPTSLMPNLHTDAYGNQCPQHAHKTPPNRA